MAGTRARRGGIHLRIREGAPAGNRGVPGLLEHREVAARGAPARARRPRAPPHTRTCTDSAAFVSTPPLTPRTMFALIAN